MNVLLVSLASNRTRLKCARAFSFRMIEVKNKTGRRDCAEESVHSDQLLSSAFPEPDIAQTPCLLRLLDGILSEDVPLSVVRFGTDAGIRNATKIVFRWERQIPSTVCLTHTNDVTVNMEISIPMAFRDAWN